MLTITSISTSTSGGGSKIFDRWRWVRANYLADRSHIPIIRISPPADDGAVGADDGAVGDDDNGAVICGTDIQY